MPDSDDEKRPGRWEGFDSSSAAWIGIGAGVGAAIGVVIGAASGNPGIGVVAGVAVGTGVGVSIMTAMSGSRRKK